MDLEQCMQYMQLARGVWGHAPPGNFLNLDVLKWILLLFGILFYHVKLYNNSYKESTIAVQLDSQMLRQCMTDRVEAREAAPSQPNQLQRHHCPFF